MKNERARSPMAKRPKNETDTDDDNAGRFYSALLSMSVPDDSPQTYRRKVLGQLQAIAALTRSRSKSSADLTGQHPTSHLITVLAYRVNEAHLIKVRELQRGLGFTAGGITRRLDAMVREGLVERLPDPEDGRALLVRLTPAGVDLAEFLLKDADHRSHALEQTFTLEEWKMLSDLLLRFEKTIE